MPTPSAVGQNGHSNGHPNSAAPAASDSNGHANGHSNGATADTNAHAVNGLSEHAVAEVVSTAEVTVPVETTMPRLVWPPAPLVEPEPEAEALVEPEPEPEPEALVEPEPEPAPQPLRPVVPPRYESWLPSPELISLPRMPPAAAPAAEPEPRPEPVAIVPVVVTDPVEAIAVPDASAPAPDPSFIERSRMRRRARYLRRLREIQMRDIGGFAVELYRYGRDRPEVVRAKIESATLTDRELRAIQRALDGRIPLRELRMPGIGGACSTCGAVYGSEDRFCAHCGTSLVAEGPEPPDPS